MKLLYMALVLIIISILLIIAGKLRKNKIIYVIGEVLLVLLIICGISFIIWSLDKNDKEYQRRVLDGKKIEITNIKNI